MKCLGQTAVISGEFLKEKAFDGYSCVYENGTFFFFFFPKLWDLQNLWENARPSTKAELSGYTTGVVATRTLSFKAMIHVMAA